jgi:hypothetical protein
MVDIATVTVIKKHVEAMNMDELRALKTDLDKEIERRERLEYDKALKKFFDALEELYSNFPNEYCFADSSVTWEELRENYDWNF